MKVEYYAETGRGGNIITFGFSFWKEGDRYELRDTYGDDEIPQHWSKNYKIPQYYRDSKLRRNMIILLSHDATNWIEVTFKEDMPRGMTISVARLLYKHLLNEGFKRV